jgi:hypothetical protein
MRTGIRVRFTDEELDELAVDLWPRFAAKLGAAPAPELVDALTVATALGISRDTVYDHAIELGGVKAFDSPKAPWRFDLAAAIAAWRPPEGPQRAQPRRRRRRDDGLLPVHGDRAAS